MARRVKHSDGNWMVTGVVSSQAKTKAIATRLPEWLFAALAEQE